MLAFCGEKAPHGAASPPPDPIMTTATALPPVDPILTRSLREHVHERLRASIVAGRFPTGERLNERQLADMLGVSTTPVKDAIRMLEGEGLVRIEARRGVFVLFSARQAFEMALGRASLESVMAHIAAKTISAEGLANLSGLVDEMEHATAHGALEDLVRLNESFHGAIHAASGCQYLERRLDGQRMYDTAQRLSLLSEPGQRQAGFVEHRGIYEALAARDPRLAETRMKRHILRSAREHVHLVFGDVLKDLDYDCD
jgi:DNA-binding GntR family transcriptional regulator